MRGEPVGLTITVELISGCGRDFRPGPGRVLSASTAHTFADLGLAIDRAFARDDLEHLRMFLLPGEIEVSWTSWRDGPAFPGTTDGRVCLLDLLRPGDSFAYLFDLGDDWTHLCTVAPAAGFRAGQPPTTRTGWGTAPRQHDRVPVEADRPEPRRSSGASGDVAAGDLIVVAGTGVDKPTGKPVAGRPAIVAVADGRVRAVTRRATAMDRVLRSR